jgi:hypothetical protein
LERDGGRGGGGLLECVEGFVGVVDPDEVEPGSETLGEFVSVVRVGDTLADDVDVVVAVVADLAPRRSDTPMWKVPRRAGPPCSSQWRKSSAPGA